MCISFYTWKRFIFVSVPLMLGLVSHFTRHQQTAEELLAWRASQWATLKIPKPTDSCSLSLSITDVGLPIQSLLGHGGIFLLFCFVLGFFFFFRSLPQKWWLGQNKTNLSECGDLFKHAALHINKSRATWSWILVRVSGELRVFDDHCRRQMHSGLGEAALGGRGETTMHRLTTTVRIILRNMNH